MAAIHSSGRDPNSRILNNEKGEKGENDENLRIW
jgi:hypothetical protein